MKIIKSATGFEMTHEQSEYIEKKFQRVKYAADALDDVSVRVRFDKKFHFDCDTHLNWGVAVHVSGEDETFEAALNAMMDVLDVKITKEKEKVQKKR